MSIHITKNRIRATGADANALFKTLTEKNEHVEGWHYERSPAGNGYCVKNGNIAVCFVHYGQDHQNLDRAERIVEAMKQYDLASNRALAKERTE